MSFSTGGDAAFTTDNGYVFDREDNQANLTVTGGADVFGPFIGGGTGTSTDSVFNTVLSGGRIGATYTFNNLTVGQAYNLLFLATDTRDLPEEESPGGIREFGIASNSFDPAFSSGLQRYYFEDGGNTLGGYVLLTFTANDSSCQFTTIGSNQLNAAILATVPETSSSLLLMGSCLSLLGLRHRIS